MPTPSPDGSSPLPAGLAPSPLSSRSWMEVQLLTTILGGPGQWTPIGDPPNKAIPWLAAGQCAPMGQRAKVGGEKPPCLGFWGTCKCHQLPGNSSLVLSFSIFCFFLFCFQVFLSQFWALGWFGLPWGEKEAYQSISLRVKGAAGALLLPHLQLPHPKPAHTSPRPARTRCLCLPARKTQGPEPNRELV